jgi:hypothetical protein
VESFSGNLIFEIYCMGLDTTLKDGVRRNLAPLFLLDFIPSIYYQDFAVRFKKCNFFKWF